MHSQIVTGSLGRAPVLKSRAGPSKTKCIVSSRLQGVTPNSNLCRTTRKGGQTLVSNAVGPGAAGPGAGLSPELRAALDEYITKHKIIVFMKGTAMFPQCGFSNTVVQILNQMGVPFQSVNILEDDSLRQGMKEYSAWPTFPQVYIDGEFYGGCDIMIEEYQNGNLKETLERVMME